MANLSFYEFFCGGGMARAGLGEGWTCLFANDFDAKKGRAYAANWGAAALKVGDVAKLSTRDLPGAPDLVWASFPCQDLSLAGVGAGLDGARSGAFWPFWRLMRHLGAERRAPRAIVLENVCGALTAHGGADFAAIANAIVAAGYRIGALVIDAAHFLPQSRPRLFIVAVAADLVIPAVCLAERPESIWTPPALRAAHERLAREAANCWLWLSLPSPPQRNQSLANLLDDNLSGAEWHTAAQTQRLVSLMSPLQRAKLSTAQASGTPQVGAIFRRTRADAKGVRRQHAEVRFDNLAGCLRTPAGGSSRQIIVVAHSDEVRSRLLSGREAARLMGLPDDYKLPERSNDALHLVGDGVAVPVVRHLADHLLAPLLRQDNRQALQAAE